MPEYALIADDLTGALDAGAGFASAGLRAVLPLSGRPEEAAQADVVLLNTESRERSSAEAAAAARLAAERLAGAGIRRLYKKIDSVLRGHPGPELAAVLDVCRGRALVAPAFPAQGRVTRHGVQYAHGAPVEPYGGFVRDALGTAASRSDIRDAETDDDLRRIALEGARNAMYRVWCGSAGLARHVPEALGFGAGTPAGTAGAEGSLATLPPASAVVVVAGTGHPATRTQTRLLLEAGWALVRMEARPPDGAVAIGRAIEEALSTHRRVVVSFSAGLSDDEWSAAVASSRAAGVTESDLLATVSAVGEALAGRAGLGLVLTGGETALQICRALNAVRVEVLGEALPGIPVGVLSLASGERIPVVTKSGGFGGADALAAAAARLLTADS